MAIIDSLVAITVMATLVQFLVDILKGVLGDWVMARVSPRIIAAVVGILLAIMFGLDIFALLGFVTRYSAVARVLTGLIISAGAEAVHELLAKLRESRGPDHG